MTDPISDMLTRIRNASMVHKATVEMPLSKMKYAIAKIFEAEGRVLNVETYQDGNRGMLRIKLKYDAKKSPAITLLRRVSTPGRRIYVKSEGLKRVHSGYGFSVISTPNGLMTGTEAKKRRLGGEVICEVY